MSDREHDASSGPPAAPPPTARSGPPSLAGFADGPPRGANGSGNGNGSRPGFDRVPPHSLEAEVSVLGAAMLSKNAANEVVELLHPADFYRSAHGTVFEAIKELQQGSTADGVTVLDWLTRHKRLDEVGGPTAIHDLTASVPTAANAMHYARIVKEKALLRQLIEAGSQVARMGYEATDDARSVVDEAESLIYRIAETGTTSEYAHLKDLLTESFELIEKLAQNRSEVTGLATGFNDLDRLTAGLQPQQLIIIAARPAMGKSSLALGIAQYVTAEVNRPAVLFSLEMSKIEIVNRLLASEARIDSHRIKTGRLEDSDWRKLSDALGKLSEAPLFIDDTPSISLMEIRSKCRRIKQRHGLDLVIVDYLQLMQSHRRVDSRQQEVAEISRGLKMLAKELDVPVIALSQLSRQPESRTDKRPQLADLRESGCVTGDTRILRADTGATVTIEELVRTGERDVPVWTLDDDYRLVRGTMTHAFPSGEKMTYRLRLASGREIKASANHPFLRWDGWAALEDLAVGDQVAVPRSLPTPDIAPMDDAEIVMLAHLIGDGCFVKRQPLHYTNADPVNIELVEQAASHWGITPRRVAQESWWHVYLPAPYRLARGKRNPICAWLDEMGLYGKRSGEKFLPERVLRLPDEQLATFLGHLWATDGHISVGNDRTNRLVNLHYSSKSRRLVDDVRLALLRLGIRSRLSQVKKSGYGTSFHLWINGVEQIRRFLSIVPLVGEKARVVPAALAALDGVVPRSAWSESFPREVWEHLRGPGAEGDMSLPELAEVAAPELAAPVGAIDRPLSRTRLLGAATAVGNRRLVALASADVSFDRIISIEPLAVEPVFDATVEGTHNFVADCIVIHNSIEQDADIVGFIYRDEVYDEESPDKGIAELIVSKHRNGATGIVRLAFLNHLTKFANLVRGPSHGGPSSGPPPPPPPTPV